MKTPFKFGYGRKIYGDAVGLDIGTSSVKMVWVRKDNASIELLGHAIKNLPKPLQSCHQ